MIDDVIIRRITLPPSVQAAIQQKLTQEQEALEFDYRIEKEKKEAERKKIEATIALAKSANAKVVIIGGKNGLPLILNTPQ